VQFSPQRFPAWEYEFAAQFVHLDEPGGQVLPSHGGSGAGNRPNNPVMTGDPESSVMFSRSMGARPGEGLDCCFVPNVTKQVTTRRIAAETRYLTVGHLV